MLYKVKMRESVVNLPKNVQKIEKTVHRREHANCALFLTMKFTVYEYFMHFILMYTVLNLLW